jgi:uncharacterized protein
MSRACRPPKSPVSTAPAVEPVPDVRRYRVTAFAVGLTAGLFSALFGVGGGLIMVPAMALLLNIRAQRAVATSLAVIIPTGLVGALEYSRHLKGQGHSGLDLMVVLWLGLGGVGGGVIGAIVANLIGAKQLKRIFGVFVVAVGAYMLMRTGGPADGAAVSQSRGALEMVGVGVLVGIVSGLLGVGGGIVMVPALVLLLGYSQHLAQGTSLAVIIPVSISGTLVHASKGNVIWSFAFWLAAGAMIGAGIMGSVVVNIPNDQLRLMFGIFMILVGASMMVTRKGESPAPPSAKSE